jgi:hypothetical protein
MITFKGVRKSWLIDFRESALSKAPLKDGALTVVCFCGTFAGFTLLFSQRESTHCDSGAVRPPVTLSSIHVPCLGAAHLLRFSERDRDRGPVMKTFRPQYRPASSDSDTTSRTMRLGLRRHESLEQRVQLVEVDWLGDVFVATRFEGFNPRFGGIMSRNRQDGGFLESLLLTNLASG